VGFAQALDMGIRASLGNGNLISQGES